MTNKLIKNLLTELINKLLTEHITEQIHWIIDRTNILINSSFLFFSTLSAVFIVPSQISFPRYKLHVMKNGKNLCRIVFFFFFFASAHETYFKLQSRQNIWNKIEKSSKIRHGKKRLMLTLACFWLLLQKF